MDWKTKHDELMDDFKAVQGDRDRYCMLAKNMKVLAQGYKVLADGYKADLEGVKAERDALRGKLERVRNQLGSYLHGMERRHVEDQWHEAQFDAALAALSDDAPAPTEPLGCNCLHECPSEEERSGGAECVHDADCVLSAQPDPTPRYDEVFHDGTAWLDKQAELDEWPDPAPAEPSCGRCHWDDPKALK